MRPTSIRTVACAAGMAVLAGGCAPHLYSTAGDTTPWAVPENTWPAVEPPDPLQSEGMSPGQTVRDVRGTDQFGDEVSIWQFWGRYVLIDISTMWCGPCQDLARDTEAVYQTYKDDGFIYLTVLHENESKKEPSLEELELWSSFPEFNEDPDHPYDRITAPIIADFKGQSGSIEAIRNNQYPVALLVGPDMKVIERIEPANEGRIHEELEAAFGR